MLKKDLGKISNMKIDTSAEMDGSVYKALKDWVDLAAKQHTEVEDEWTDIPNVGKFKNLTFVPEPSELDNEITITLRYDNWKQTEIGKFAIKRTSKEWEALVPKKYKLRIIDPDGWDRSGDFDYSFNKEKITKNEFDRRLSVSTISVNVVFFTEDWETGEKIC